MHTLFIGKQLVFLYEVESTNTYAINQLHHTNIIEGTIVYTDNQTAGKGQRGAMWHSDSACNVTMSCILKPHFLDTKYSFYLSKISALALYDVLTEILNDSQYDIKIKWPNDILVNQKKIAGILIENQLQKNNIQHSVIGIGLNVNQTEFKDLQKIISSLKLLTKKEFDRLDVIQKISHYLEKWYLKLKTNKFAEIDLEYHRHLFKINERVSFQNNESIFFEATIICVNEDGTLKICDENNTYLDFEVKQLRLIF